MTPFFSKVLCLPAVQYSVLRVYAFKDKRIRGDTQSVAAGVYDGEVPPVPIPNTEVKLTCAEDSSLETARENR